MLVVMLGCQSSAPRAGIAADDCPKFLAKAHATIEEMGARAKLPYTAEMEANAERDCRADVAAGKPMVLARCVLDAPDDAGVHACFPTYDQLKAP